MALDTPVLDQTDGRLRAVWHPVALSSEVGAQPMGVMLLGEGWVLTRLNGGIQAFRDRCPHRLAPLSAGGVVNDELQCGYHGWRFDHTGMCTEIPALGPGAALPSRAQLSIAFGVCERAGIVWLAVEEPLIGLPEVNQEHNPEFRFGALEPMETQASAGALIDNFCDVAHFGFLHRGTIGTGSALVVDEVRTELTDDGWVVTSVDNQMFANREDPGVAAGLRPELQHRTATYQYRVPFTATLRLEYVDAGGENFIVFAVQPQTATQCRVYTVLYRNDIASDEAMQESVGFEQRVLAEDLAFQARGHAPFPLSIRAELHTRADRLTLEIRRVLIRLLLS